MEPAKEAKGKGKIAIRQYPYTYVRVCVMRGRLIDRATYDKLMKMKMSEIAKFMQETEYRREIDELASKHSGMRLIESALNANMIRTFLKLKRISEDRSLSELIDTYMMRWDIWNIKTILRGKHSDQKNEEIKELLMPIGLLGEAFFDSLLQKDSVAEIASSLKFMDFSNLNNAMHAYREKKQLFDIENAIDHDYYSYMMDFSKRIPEQGRLFREFIEYDIDIANIKMLLRMRKEKMDRKDLERYLLYPGARLDMRELKRLSETDDLKAMLRFLQRAGYPDMAKEMEKKDSMLSIELMLNRHLLGRAALLQHQHPLSVDVILGYMLAKEIEVRNIKTIIKGKQLGLAEDFIESQLVIGG